jgi:hypothetical protein
MRSEYDFSKPRKNPYANQLQRQVTIRLDTAAVDYFKKMAAELGMPYQNLINLFLRDCAIQKRRATRRRLCPDIARVQTSRHADIGGSLDNGAAVGKDRQQVRRHLKSEREFVRPDCAQRGQPNRQIAQF